jgi:PAS domain S-box-containing protein
MNKQPDFLIGNVLREFLYSSPIGICVINTKGIIQEANPAFCRITGYSREDILTRLFTDIEEQEASDRLANHRVEILTMNEACYAGSYRRKDGSAFKAETRVSIVGLEGQPFWLIFIGEF